MDNTIAVAIIGLGASVVTASLSFALTKRAERIDALQQRKVEHYRELLSAVSDLAVDGADKDEANKKFARAANTIALVAPQGVIKALMAFHDEVKFSNPSRSLEGHDRKLKDLLLAIRRRLDLPFRDDPETFDFHLIGSKPGQRNR